VPVDEKQHPQRSPYKARIVPDIKAKAGKRHRDKNVVKRCCQNDKQRYLAVEITICQNF